VGINRHEAMQMQDVIATCERIAVTCRDLAEVFGADAADFGAVRSEAGKLHRQADVVLRTDYSRGYAQPPGR